jgi:hypothetical protein
MADSGRKSGGTRTRRSGQSTARLDAPKSGAAQARRVPPMHASLHVADPGLANAAQATIRREWAASLEAIHRQFDLHKKLSAELRRTREAATRIIERLPVTKLIVLGIEQGAAQRHALLDEGLRKVRCAVGWISGVGDLDPDEAWLINAQRILSDEEIAAILWRRNTSSFRGDAHAAVEALAGLDRARRADLLKNVRKRRARLEKKLARLRADRPG